MKTEMKNPNHPKKESSIKVEPITKLKDIDTIKKLLRDNPRNYALFVLGINTNLRASDLVNLTIGQVRHLKPLDSLEIKEMKTGKKRRVTLNKGGTGTKKLRRVYLTVPSTTPFSFGRATRQKCSLNR